MSLVFLGYVVAALLAHPPWATVAVELVHPHFELAPAYLFTFVAVIGTTISPYMQVFFQSSLVEKRGGAGKYWFYPLFGLGGKMFCIFVIFFFLISCGAGV